MVQVVDRPPSFAELIGKGLGSGLGAGIGQGTQFLQQLALQKAKTKEDKSVQKTLEDYQKFSTGLETIRAMRDVIARGNTGRGSGIWGVFGGEAARDRQELSQLGTSLIPLVAAGVPIRNQKEFEQYKKVITDPGSLTDEMIGALDALEKVFENKLAGPSHVEKPSEADEFIHVRNKKTGKVHKIPSSKLKEALAAGGEEI